MAHWNLSAGPGTHALVVGVGEYPWLLGGSQTLFSDHEGMAQLTSAPISALRFAEWLATSYVSDRYPLRSLRVLVSAPGLGAWTPRPDLPAKVPERARFEKLEDAILAWHGDLGPNDRALFFFSGHGIAVGDEQTLLCEDYGEVPVQALHRALDFKAFRVAMASAPALQQFYVIDACRVASGRLIRSKNHYGQPVLDPSGELPSPPRNQPWLCATTSGAFAYGRDGQTSLFTEALLKAMRGAGAQRTAHGWAVRPASLVEGIHCHLTPLANQYGATQACEGYGITAGLDLHEVADPEVPVVVRCGAPIDPAAATVIASGPANREQLPPLAVPFTLDLPVGEYTFVATPPGGAPREETVWPPSTEVTLP